MSDNLDSIMRRVQKLLAIAQDDRANPNEAAAAAGMAERIMRKYQIDHSELIIKELKAGADLETSECLCTAKTNGTKVESVPLWASWMASAVADFNDCGAQIATNSNREKVVRFYGYAGDVQVAKYMLDYLVATTLRLCREFKTTEDYAVYGRSGLASYRSGVASGICSAVRALIEVKEQEQASTGTALVVVKQDAIVAKYGEVFGKKSSKTKTTSGHNFSAGFQDGRKVDVNVRGVTGSSAAAPRLN